MARQPKLKDETLPLSVQAMVAEADELDEAFSELPSEDTKVAVYRMRDQGRSAYIQSYMLTDFNVETLRERHGGGRFKLVASSKANREKVEKIIEVEGNPVIQTAYPRHPDGYYGKRGTADRPMPVDGWPTLETNDPQYLLLQEIKELRREMNRNSGTQDPGLMQLIGQLLTKAPATEQVEEKIFNRLIQLKSLFGGTEPKTDSNIIFQAMKTGMEMISNAEASNGSPWLALAEKGLPLIQNLLVQLAQSQARNGAIPMPGPTNQPPAKPATPEPLAAPQGFAAIAGQLQPYLPTFMQSAAVDADPNILVELTASNIPEAQKPVVIDWLQGATWQQDLISMNNGISLQLKWWTDYHDLLLEILTGKEQDTDP